MNNTETPCHAEPARDRKYWRDRYRRALISIKYIDHIASTAKEDYETRRMCEMFLKSYMSEALCGEP